MNAPLPLPGRWTSGVHESSRHLWLVKNRGIGRHGRNSLLAWLIRHFFQADAPRRSTSLDKRHAEVSSAECAQFAADHPHGGPEQQQRNDQTGQREQAARNDFREKTGGETGVLQRCNG